MIKESLKGIMSFIAGALFMFICWAISAFLFVASLAVGWMLFVWFIELFS